MQMDYKLNKSTLKTLLYLLLCITLFGNFGISHAQISADDTPPESPEEVTLDYFVYLPLTISSSAPPDPATFDLTIGHVEVTQAVQTLGNDVPMVTGRRTVLRVYAHTDDEVENEGVQILIDAYRNGQQLPGAPILINDKTAKIWETNAQLENLRSDITNSVNFQLPTDWLNGQVTLNITIDPSNVISETNEANNVTEMILEYNDVPTLEVVVVPVRYIYGGYYVFPAPTNFDYLIPRFMKLYPIHNINISIHSPITYNGSDYDLTSVVAWERLLNQVNTLRRSEVGTGGSKVYYAVVPLDDGDRTTWYPGGGIQGIGFIGIRSSVGLVDLPDLNVNGSLIAAHEFGHNFGQDHAPCNLPVSESDPDYPYDGGVIGQYGFDMDNFVVIPKSRADVMGYCRPVWVSDYTYESLYGDQRRFLTTADTIPQDNLFIRVSFDAQGIASIEPIYELSNTPDEFDLASDYWIEFIDDQGIKVDQAPVSLLTMNANGITGKAIQAMVPKPKETFSSIQLTYKGQVIAERSFESSPTALDRTPNLVLSDNELMLTWSSPGKAAMVRISADQGKSWETIAVDVIQGEWATDPEDLPAGDLLIEIKFADQVDSSLEFNWVNPIQH